MPESGPFFNKKQFSLAVKGIGLNPENIGIAHRILVEKQSRQKVMLETGLTKQRISQIIQAVMDNFEKQLSHQDLIFIHCIINKNNAELVEKLENEALRNFDERVE